MPHKSWEDQKAAQRRHYQSKKEYYKKKAREREARIKEWVRQYKVDSGCSRCGEIHIACLEFHHREQLKKEFNIFESLQKGWGKDRIQQEIDKCDVLCSNCHKKLHWDNKTFGLNRAYLSKNHSTHSGVEQFGSSRGS